jgi:hypothetical protein
MAFAVPIAEAVADSATAAGSAGASDAVEGTAVASSAGPQHRAGGKAVTGSRKSPAKKKAQHARITNAAKARSQTSDTGKSIKKKVGRKYKTGATVTRPGYGNLAEQVKISRHLLVAEFFVCMFVVVFGHMAAKNNPKSKSAAIPGWSFARQATTVCVAFVMLSLITAIGYRAARIAAGIGGLMVMALLLNKSDDILWVLNSIAGNADNASASADDTQQKSAAVQNTTNQAVSGTPTESIVDRGLEDISTVIDTIGGILPL